MSARDLEVARLLDEVVAEARKGGLIQVSPIYIKSGGKAIPASTLQPSGDKLADHELLRLLTEAIEREAENPSGQIEFHSGTGAGVTNYAARKTSTKPS